VQYGHVSLPQRTGLDIGIVVQELDQAKRRVLRRTVSVLKCSPVSVLDHRTRMRQAVIGDLAAGRAFNLVVTGTASPMSLKAPQPEQ
jgi:hypothetical protein